MADITDNHENKTDTPSNNGKQNLALVSNDKTTQFTNSLIPTNDLDFYADQLGAVKRVPLRLIKFMGNCLKISSTNAPDLNKSNHTLFARSIFNRQNVSVDRLLGPLGGWTTNSSTGDITKNEADLNPMYLPIMVKSSNNSSNIMKSSILRVLIVRVIISLYCSIVLIYDLAKSGGENGYWLAFFTNLSFLSLNLYFWLMVCLVGFEWLKLRRSETLLSPIRRAGFIHHFASVVYGIQFGFHLLVPLVYWALLGPSQFNWDEASVSRRWVGISVHGINGALMLLVESVWLNRIRMDWTILWWGLIPGLAAYVCWAWLAGGVIWPNDGDSGGYPYFFLNLDSPENDGPGAGTVVVYMVLLAILMVLVFFIGLGWHWLRSKFDCWLLGGSRMNEVKSQKVLQSSSAMPEESLQKSV